MTAVALPDLGTDRVTFSLWYVRVGDRVFTGDRVAEVLIPGATFDIHAPTNGVLLERLVLPNDPLTPRQTLGWIEEDERERG